MRFVTGYGLSYVFYWITLLSIGWWMWETTGSAAWVGIACFCDLFPSVLITPFAAALADRGDRFRILKTILWLQVCTRLTLAAVAASGMLTPPVLAGFAFVEGTLVGFSQPAFFGLLNRLVTARNLSAAVGVNVSVVQTSYILGPLLAGLIHARRNSDVGQEVATGRAMVALLLFAAVFPLLAWFPGGTVRAVVGLFLTGQAGSYVMTGNSTILQTRTPEHMRSRVLGNNLMLSRGTGAVSVLCVGLLADAWGFGIAMTGAVVFAAAALATALRRGGQPGQPRGELTRAGS